MPIGEPIPTVPHLKLPSKLPIDRKMHRLCLPTAWLSLFLLLPMVGCGDHEPVTTYTVKSEPGPVVQQIEAAVVFADNQAWVFKLAGDPEIVSTQHDKLMQFLGSVGFSEEQQLTYDLPTGWRVVPKSNVPSGPGSETIAEIEVTNRPQPKLVISKFPTEFSAADGEFEQAQQRYLLDNVNRWRRQVALPRLETNSLESAGEVFITGTGQTGHLFSMTGQLEPAGRQPPQSRFFDLDVENYESPEGWTLVENTQFSKLHFVAGPERNIDISVTDLSMAGGNSLFQTVLSNVSRWSTQLALPQFDPAMLPSISEPTQVDGHQGLVVNLVSDGPVPSESHTEKVRILGVVILAEGSVWTVRMKGPADLVQVQRGKMDQFLESLKFKAIPRQVESRR